MVNGKYLKELWPIIREQLLCKIEIGEVHIEGHARDQSVLRKVSKEIALDIAMNNPIEEMFKEWEYPYGEKKFKNPDRVFTISGRTIDGFVVAVPFAVKMDRSGGKNSLKFYPVTVIHTNNGRHAKN